MPSTGVIALPASPDPRAELHRLRAAIDALSDHLDSIDRRRHSSFRAAAENSNGSEPSEIEAFVAPFAFAVKRGTQP